MNNRKTSKLPYLIIALVVSGALLAYFYWSGNSSSGGLTLEEINGGDQIVGVKVLNLLNEISALKIDTQFFKDTAYLTLRDYTVPIATLPVGRSNPFSPVPGMSLTPSTGTR